MQKLNDSTPFFTPLQLVSLGLALALVSPSWAQDFKNEDLGSLTLQEEVKKEPKSAPADLRAPAALPLGVPQLGSVKKTRSLLLIPAPEGRCSSCSTRVASLLPQIEARLKRSGFFVTQLKPEELASAADLVQDERLNAVLREKSQDAAFVVSVALMPPEDPDSMAALTELASPGEKWKLQLRVKAPERPPLLQEKVIASEEEFLHSSLELQDRLVDDYRKATEVVAELGPKKEIWIQIRGVRDFAHMNTLKAQVGTLLNDGSVVQEKVLEVGKITFSFQSGRSLESLKSLLGATQLEPKQPSSIEVSVSEARSRR
ncbi:MAG: hypothetical protein ACO3A2_10625 [Bdellovibrionia bacterium]